MDPQSHCHLFVAPFSSSYAFIHLNFPSLRQGSVHLTGLLDASVDARLTAICHDLHPNFFFSTSSHHFHSLPDTSLPQ